MNAKKIMGAVLVALLAAALFVGAGAAVGLAEGDNGTYFIYQSGLTAADFDGTWTNGAASVVIENGVILPVGEFVPGTYTKGKATITVLNPSVSYKLTAKYNGVPYLVGNGGTVYNASQIQLTITPLAEYKGAGVDWSVNVLKTVDGKTPVNQSNPWAGEKFLNVTGTYKIQALFGADGFVNGVPADILLDATAFTFKVVEADDATISASTDTVFAGNSVTITVVGTPGTGYEINSTDITLVRDQLINVTENDGNLSFTMPNTGKASFVVGIKNDAKKEVVIKLIYNGKFLKDEEVKIKISAPVVTATLVKPSYFLGENITVTGTATAAQEFVFNISGTNVEEFTLVDDQKAEKNWKANLSLPADKKLDVGTYTIKVYQTGTKNVVATLAVALKQPFISIAEAPEVIAQNESATFLITAEAADGVLAYFFGTNYFNVEPSVPELDEDDEPIPGLFNVTLPATETHKDKMATGQYFAVFQHPMYDEKFNIGAADDGIVKLNTKGPWNNGDGTELFNAKSRQTANAAQALCDALDSQNIDDMYVKYSFFVVADLKKDTFSMSEIPSEVVKGDKIVISGVDTASKEGTPVTVEMISTAFAAVPKETVGSAAFIVATTTVAEDGTWEVTLDTSDLNVDEYSLSVAINAVPKESVTVNVVEGSEPVTPTDEPTVVPTDEPVTPTEAPATPGFGALAALAGLGAVAVLLLRRE